MSDQSPARAKRFRHLTESRPLFMVLLVVALILGASGRIADLFLRDSGSWLSRSAQGIGGAVQYRVEHAIYIGGIQVSRSRNSIAGAAIGCASGAAAGAGTAAMVGLVTAGAGFAAIPAASAAGCGLGMVSGVMYGRPLDTYVDEE